MTISDASLTSTTLLDRYRTTRQETESLAGLVLANRLVWLGVTAVIALGAAALFRFRQDSPFRFGRRRAAAPSDVLSATLAPIARIELPPATRKHGLGAALAQYRTTLKQIDQNASFGAETWTAPSGYTKMDLPFRRR